MTSRDFCYWLQGFMELRDAAPGPDTAGGLNRFQAECVKKHLALVFKHEIDPGMGGPQHQATLDIIHDGKSGGGPTFRC